MLCVWSRVIGSEKSYFCLLNKQKQTSSKRLRTVSQQPGTSPRQKSKLRISFDFWWFRQTSSYLISERRRSMGDASSGGKEAPPRNDGREDAMTCVWPNLPPLRNWALAELQWPRDASGWRKPGGFRFRQLSRLAGLAMERRHLAGRYGVASGRLRPISRTNRGSTIKERARPATRWVLPNDLHGLLDLTWNSNRRCFFGKCPSNGIYELFIASVGLENVRHSSKTRKFSPFPFRTVYIKFLTSREGRVWSEVVKLVLHRLMIHLFSSFSI